MKKIFILLALVLSGQRALAQNKDAEEIKGLNQKWLNSYPKKDSVTLANIFADDLILISPKGAKMTKYDIIKNLTKQEIVSITVDSVDVRMITPEVGLLTAYTTFILKVDGKDVKGSNCYQDMYVKRKNKWLAVAAHVTLLNGN